MIILWNQPNIQAGSSACIDFEDILNQTLAEPLDRHDESELKKLLTDHYGNYEQWRKQQKNRGRKDKNSLLQCLRDLIQSFQSKKGRLMILRCQKPKSLGILLDSNDNEVYVLSKHDNDGVRHDIRDFFSVNDVIHGVNGSQINDQDEFVAIFASICDSGNLEILIERRNMKTVELSSLMEVGFLERVQASVFSSTTHREDFELVLSECLTSTSSRFQPCADYVPLGSMQEISRPQNEETSPIMKLLQEKEYLEVQLEHFKEKFTDMEDILKAIPLMINRETLATFDSENFFKLQEILGQSSRLVREVHREFEEKRKNKEREEPDETLCCICCERKKSILLNPCKHVCICGECATRDLDCCPICRETIEEATSVFF